MYYVEYSEIVIKNKNRHDGNVQGFRKILYSERYTHSFENHLFSTTIRDFKIKQLTDKMLLIRVSDVPHS